MSYITKNLKQIAVYWAPNGRDEHGERAFLDAVEMNVRWEEKKILFINFNREEEASNAVIYTDTDVVEGGMVCLCTLDELDSDISVPYYNTALEIWEIKGFDKNPDIKGKIFERVIYV